MEPPKRQAALELTRYLQSVKPGSEDKRKVKAFMARMGTPSDTGMYGVRTARVIMQHGLIPEKPFYWTDERSEKAALVKLVTEVAHIDPERAPRWNALLASLR